MARMIGYCLDVSVGEGSNRGQQMTEEPGRMWKNSSREYKFLYGKSVH